MPRLACTALRLSCGNVSDGLPTSLVRHLPTTDGGPVMTAVLGKHTDIGHCVVPAVCLPQTSAGKVRLLAIVAAERNLTYPDVPTLRKLG